MTVPSSVAANQAYLDSVHVWYLVSRNEPAVDCADAANKRSRLGNPSIPLSDELKSHVGAYEHPEGRRYVAVHCRGHQLRDDLKIGALLGYRVDRVSAEELESVFGLQKGLVNPFVFARQSSVTQIFDESVIERYFPPYTMMTNLGDTTYGVEFHPHDLVDAIPNAQVADIVTNRSRRSPIEPSLGILTGNSPESGIALWERINERIRKDPHVRFRGDTGFPRVIVESVPDMGLSMELPSREAEVRETVLNGVDRLCAGGATVVGIACNTTQYFSHEVNRVCADHGARFVSMVDETAAVLHSRSVHKFDLLGIGAVSDLSRWSDFRRIANRFEIAVPSQADITRITELAFEVKKRRASGRAVSALGVVINRATVTDTVLLALTELSIVVAKHPALEEQSGKRFIDTLSALADRMAEVYLEERRPLESLQRSRGEQAEKRASTLLRTEQALELKAPSGAEGSTTTGGSLRHPDLR